MNLLNRLKKIEESLIPHQTSLPIVLHLGSKRAWVDSTEYSTLQDAKQANPASIGVYSVTDIDTVYLLLKTLRGEIPGYSGNHEE